MKKSGIAVLLALGLAACGGGGGDRALLVDSCVAEGEEASTCECMADLAESELSPEAYATMVDLARDGGDNAEQIMSELPMSQQTEFMGFMFQAATQCEIM